MIKDSQPRIYKHRNSGDVLQNGAVLVERVNGQKWKIKCPCGNIFISQPSYTSGRCKLCGFETIAKSKTIHGESPSEEKNATRLYRIWLGMRNRCNNPNDDSYKSYGGRGISVCDEWSDYLSFKEWALSNGYEETLSIDRIDNNGNYDPSNCRWSTVKEQNRNKRKNHLIEYNGEIKTLVEWSEQLGIAYHTLKNRINRYKMPVEVAFTRPVRVGNNQYGDRL